jgi:hypothetical protein
MNVEEIKRILKESVTKYHTTIIYEQQPKGSFKTYDIEPYDYKTINGKEYLYGYDITQNKYIDIELALIVDVSDTGKTFSPRQSSKTILEYFPK